MKPLVWISLLAGCISFTTNIPAQDGTPDPGFGQQGIVYPDLPEFTRAFSNVVLSRPDGSVITAGNVMLGNEAPGTPYDLYLFQYREDGAPDTSFGMAGSILAMPSPYADLILAGAVQPDGKLLIAGKFTKFIKEDNDPNADFFVSRYLLDGTPDPAFGTGGRASVPISTGTDQPNQIALQADGKIVVAGYVLNGRSLTGFLFRFLPDGSPDPGFGNGGLVYQYFPGGSPGNDIRALLLQSDGKIIVAGARSSDHLLIRYLSNGTRDSTFADGGVLQFNSGKPNAYIENAVLRPDGSILAVINYSLGFDSFSPKYSYLIRIAPSGQVDNTFGTDGILELSPPDVNMEVAEMRHQPDGKLLLTGWTQPTGQPDKDGMVMRLLPDLSPDMNFGQAGLMTFRVGPYDNQGRTINLQADGKILVAGDHFQDDQFEYLYVPFLIRLENEKPLAVQEHPETLKGLRVFPNPVSERLQLQYELPQQDRVSIRLYDQQGRLVHSILENQLQPAGPQEQDITLPSRVATGVYVLSIFTTQGRSTIQVVKH